MLPQLKNIGKGKLILMKTLNEMNWSVCWLSLAKWSSTFFKNFFEALYSSFVANTLQEMGSFSFQLRWIFSLVFLFFFWNFVSKVSLKEKVLTTFKFDCSSNQLSPTAPLFWKIKVKLNFSVESSLIFEILIKFCIDLSIFSSKHREIGVFDQF